MKKKNKELSFKDIIDVLLPKLWIMLLVAVVLTAAVSVYFAVFKDETYTSSSIVYVYNEKANSTTTSTGDLQAAEQMVNVYKIAITGGKFLKFVCSDPSVADYNLTPEQIKGMLSFTQLEETGAFRIAVTSGNSQLSYDVALAVTNGIGTYIQGQEGIIKNALQSSVIEDPAVPSAPNSKGTVSIAAITFVATLVVAAVIIWARSLFDVVIRSTKEIEENIDVPVLGAIPRHEISTAEEGKA